MLLPGQALLWGGCAPGGAPRADVLSFHLGSCTWSPLCAAPPALVAPPGLLLHVVDETVVVIGGGLDGCATLRLADALKHTAFDHRMRIEVRC